MSFVVDGGSIISLCRQKGIQMLAFDFDSTLISIHTGGMWTDGAQKLAEFVRPSMKRLLSAALGGDMNVSIVTYSSQQWLIREFLKLILPKSNTGKIIIRGNTPEFVEKIRSSRMGKEDHIAFVINEFYTKHQKIIHPNEILLLDDDNENVQLAVRFGHKAFEVKDNVSLQDIQSYLKTLPNKPKST